MRGAVEGDWEVPGWAATGRLRLPVHIGSVLRDASGLRSDSSGNCWTALAGQ